MGPVGRIAVTVALLLIFPWWAIFLPLRSIWRKTRVPDGAPPTAIDHFRQRHPLLGRELRLGRAARLAIVALAVAGGVAVWLMQDSVDRLVWIGVILIAGASLVLAGAHDL
jgi:hypothetical protein